MGQGGRNWAGPAAQAAEVKRLEAAEYAQNIVSECARTSVYVSATTTTTTLCPTRPDR